MTGCPECPHLYIEHSMDHGCKKCDCFLNGDDILAHNKKGTDEELPVMEQYSPRGALVMSTLCIVGGLVIWGVVLGSVLYKFSFFTAYFFTSLSIVPIIGSGLIGYGIRQVKRALQRKKKEGAGREK